MELDRAIDITAEQRKILLELLERCLPNTAAWVYGSRAKRTSRPQSDLDLVVFATPEQNGQVGELREAFEESNLPFRVDLFVWDGVPAQFRKHIKRDHVVLVERGERDVAGEWCSTTIGGLLAADGGGVKTGPFGTALKAKEYSKVGVPLISVGEVGYGSLRLHEKTPMAPREVVERLPEYLLEAGDIVFGRKGAVDRSALVKPSQAGWFLGSDGIRLRLPTTCDPRFIAYQLQGEASRLWLLHHATGTTMASLNQEIIGRVPIVLPPIEQQRAIAHILGTLDDKIELNRRMNETLEAMARALFKSWFVDFDPVRAKMADRDTGLPKHLADLFPDRLVDSELGEIPEGWEVSAIECLAEVSSGKRPGRRYAEASDLAQVPLWGGNGPMAFVPEPLVEYPILLTGRVGTLGSIFRITSPCWPSDNTLIFTVKNKRTFEFLFFQLKRIDFTSLNRGSTQPLVTQTNLKTQIILLPPANVLERFHAFSKILYARLDKSEGESRTLSALCDALLPKLISGELRISDVGAVVSRVGG